MSQMQEYIDTLIQCDDMTNDRDIQGSYEHIKRIDHSTTLSTW